MKIDRESISQDKLRATELHFSRKPIGYYFHKAESDPAYREKLGHHYLNSQPQQITNVTNDDFTLWIQKLYRDLRIQTKYVYGQPYSSSEEMTAKFKATGVLEISGDFNKPVVLSPANNLSFRAVHDSHHLLLKAPFSWQGEIKAVRYFCSLTRNPIFHRILFSEIILQAAAYFVLGGKFPDEQKLVLSLPE